MTVPGIDVTVAVSILAAVGDFGRFDSPDRLVSYLGLNPRVRQSGNGPADTRPDHQGRTRPGPRDARRSSLLGLPRPRPLRAFYRRVKDRRGFQIATVATARKMTVLCWHLINRGEDYAFARPSLNAHKRRKLELAAGAISKRGPARGASHDYHVKQLRDQERALVEHAERSYEVTGRPLATPTTGRVALDNLIRRVDDSAKSGGNARNGMTCSQASRQDWLIAGSGCPISRRTSRARPGRPRRSRRCRSAAGP